jgi:DNA-binding PadR family transcriptional regulator
MRALEERGFSDGSAAIVSQLHRMKKLGIIEQPANGMYEVTQDGLGHLRKLKASFGALGKSEERFAAR